jgi:hypothetical protein
MSPPPPIVNYFQPQRCRQRTLLWLIIALAISLPIAAVLLLRVKPTPQPTIQASFPTQTIIDHSGRFMPTTQQ